MMRRFQAPSRWMHVGLSTTIFLTALAAYADGIPPIPQWRSLSSWLFDATNLTSSIGDVPRASFGLSGVPGIRSNAVQVTGSLALLNYNEIEANGRTNITCDAGSLEFWFRPDWSSANNGGSGPGAYGRLIELGAFTQDSSYGWWSLYVDSAGTNIYFGAQTNGASVTYLSAPIRWSSNYWHIIDLSYSSTNSLLYVDGQLLASGGGMTYWPSASVRTNGFAVGSDSSGSNVVHGTFDDLRTWRDPFLPTYDVIGHQTNWMARYNPNDPGDTGQQNGFAPGSGETLMLNGEESQGCVPNGPVRIVNLAVTPAAASEDVTVTFDIAGGEGGVLYDIFSIGDLVGNKLNEGAWTWLGSGYTCNSYLLTDQPPGRRFYMLGLPVDTDNDGLTDAYEELISKTNPGNPDIDGDGLVDGEEVLVYGTDPNAIDTDGDGLPDNYEISVTHTDPNSPDTGATGVSDGARDVDGDGWTNLQELQNNSNPGSFDAPLPPQVFALSFSPVPYASGPIGLNWEPSAGAVTAYEIERSTGPAWASLTTVGPEATSFVDQSPNSGWNSYRIRAIYGPSRASEWADASTFDYYYQTYKLGLTANLIGGSLGRLYVVFPAFGKKLQSIRVTYYDFSNAEKTVDITPSQAPNQIWEVPQEILTAGFISPIFQLTDVSGRTTGDYGIVDGSLAANYDRSAGAHIPFADLSEHMEANVKFILRSSDAAHPFGFDGSNLASLRNFRKNYSYENSFVFSGFTVYNDSARVTDLAGPARESYLWRNFVFDTADIIPWSGWTTGAGYDAGTGRWQLNNPKYTFPSGGTFGNPLSGANSSYTYWNWSLPTRPVPLANIGLNASASLFTMDATTHNFYGLEYLGDKIWTYHDTTSSYYDNVAPGGSVPSRGSQLDERIFFQLTADPQFQTVGYYFAQTPVVGFSEVNISDPIPSEPGFSVDQAQRPVFVAAVGQQIRLSAWAKRQILNSTGNKFAYVERYFDKAYKLDANGNVTTQETGLLSEYGEFFPTEPGRVALTTKPDANNNNQVAQVVVHVLKLQLDSDHNGQMDLTFGGADDNQTGTPFEFWVNDDFDRYHEFKEYTTDGLLLGTILVDSEEDDLGPDDLKDLPQAERVPDFAFTRNGSQQIASKRDLEDYARLWTVGFQELMAVLPQSYHVRLELLDDAGTQLRVFKAGENDGGTLYLTDETAALNQMNSTLYPCYGVLSASTPIDLTQLFRSGQRVPTDYFIFCGAHKGTGRVALTVTDENERIIARDSADVNIKDVKEMYERWTVGDVGSLPPAAIATPAVEGLSSPFEYTYDSFTDQNTPYILHVHGWNMEAYEKDRYAETAFKRLYWQGYQGRFGLFRWPTFDRWPTTRPSRGGLLNHHDKSQFQAWKSAVGLHDLLVKLDQKYPGKVRLSAHSMGSVVAGEALRMHVGPPIVTVYAAMQAEIPSHTYDASTPVRSLGAADSGTPNRYAKFWTETSPPYFNVSPGAASYVNFYNPVDYALKFWESNENLKPDAGYIYSGTTFTRFGPTTLSFPTPNPAGGFFWNDTYEIFSFADEARCFALGASAGVQGVFNVNSEVLLDPDFNFGDAHKGHSAEFRSTNMKRAPFWQRYLRRLEL